MILHSNRKQPQRLLPVVIHLSGQAQKRALRHDERNLHPAGIQEEIFRKNQMQPTVNFETARARTIFEMISYGLCCALVCEYHVRSQKPQKAKILAMPEHPCWELTACYRKGKYVSAAEKHLIQLVQQYCTGSLEDA